MVFGILFLLPIGYYFYNTINTIIYTILLLKKHSPKLFLEIIVLHDTYTIRIVISNYL